MVWRIWKADSIDFAFGVRDRSVVAAYASCGRHNRISVVECGRLPCRNRVAQGAII